MCRRLIPSPEQMRVTLQLETEAFQAVFRRWAATTTRELSKAINARMFYLMLRLYVLIPPMQVTAARQKVRTYLNAVLTSRTRTLKSGKVKSKPARQQLQRAILIAQGRRKKMGLRPFIPSDEGFADKMTKAASNIRRAGISGQGYVKASVVKVLKLVNGGFAQWGFAAKGGRKGSTALTKPAIPPNAALAKIGAEYGLDATAGNVGIFKNSKGAATLALPGINPTATASLQVGLRDGNGNDAKVAAIVNPAMSRALADERNEMEAHMTAIAQDIANQVQEGRLIDV